MKKQKNKGGRPPSPEPLVKIGRHIRENQLPVTAEEIRAALDFYREHHQRTFAEMFSPIPNKQDIADV